MGAAVSALKDAELKREAREAGWRYGVLTAIILSALFLEALSNLVGEHLIENWKEDFESATPRAKLRLLSSKLDIDYNKNEYPWIDVLWLFKLRNSIAHAKPESIKERKHLTEKEYDQQWFERPQSKLERELTIRNASRAVKTAKQIRDIFWKKIPAEKEMGIYADLCVGSTTMKYKV
jgi:hypothetical protein